METKDILKKLREDKGLSRIEVATALKIDRTTYGKWETGDSKPVRKLKELADYFGVSSDYLLGYAPEPNVKEKPKDLMQILEREEVALNGRIMSLEDKEKMKKIIEMLYWDAVEKNKRKK